MNPLMDLTRLEKYNQNRAVMDKSIFCYAPYKYLYFSFNGDVFVCCDNKKIPVGNCFDQTIKEIWLGDTLNKFRQRLAKSDLSMNCQVCEDLLRDGLYDSLPALRYDWMNLNKNNYPAFLEFELTNKCNLKCVMCGPQFSTAFGNEDRVVVEDYGDSFIEQLNEFIPYLQGAAFKGGEPFLIDKYYKIWERIIEIKPDMLISVVTNGTIMNERIRNLLNKGNFLISISIDSLRETIYEKIRFNAKFKNVMNNIKDFHDILAQRQNQMLLMVCPMTVNWEDLPELVNFANSLGSKIFFNTMTCPEDLSLKYLNKVELRRICNELSQFNFREITDLEKYNKSIYKNMLDQLYVWSKETGDING